MMLNSELKAELISKGVDSKLLDMPAICERIQKASISIDDIIVNPDGTFRFGDVLIQRATVERDEVSVTSYETTDPYGLGDVQYHTKSEIKKVQRDVIAIVEHLQVEEEKNQALDAPFNLNEGYKPTRTIDIARMTILDDDGLEVEMQEIDNEFFVREKIEQGELGYKIFEENPSLVSKKLKREKGIITETLVSGAKYEFYDTGSWSVQDLGAGSIGTIDGDRPSTAISIFESNSQKLVERYPHVQSSMEKRKYDLMSQIDQRTLSALSDNLTLKFQNERLQEMLQKALEFVQAVKNSRVGSIFFGRKAREVLGDKDKSAKQLSDGR